MGSQYSYYSTNAPDSIQPAPASVPVHDDESVSSYPSALVICGPSGVGKGTLIKRLMSESDQFGFAVSHTTRYPRPGEKNGEHYYFVTKEQFAKELAEGKFLESAEVHDNLYGTSFRTVESTLKTGRVCILDVDIQGARSVRKAGLKALFIFIAPPSLEDLAKRLKNRQTESIEQMQNRLEAAKIEINSLNEKGLFDYLLINDDLEECLQELRRIAARAAAGLPAEPGQVPEKVILEEAPLPFSELELDGEEAQDSGPVPVENNHMPAAVQTLATASPSNPGSNSTQSAFPPIPQPSTQHLEPVLPSSSVAVPPSVLSSLETDGRTQYNPGGMAKWNQKVALVTGASSGIGWAICEELAIEGMRVVAVARRKDRLEKLTSHLHSLGVPPASFLPVVCDIAKDAEVNTLPRIVAKRWPDAGIDVLVNNAGLARNDASLFDGSVASWVEMLSTNVLGACMMTHAVLQDMERRNSYGHIINIVGTTGREMDVSRGGSFYDGTKTALQTITDGLRQEARARNLKLRVTSISPSAVQTEFLEVRFFGDKAAAAKADSETPKALHPKDVAQTVIRVLSAPLSVAIDNMTVRPAV